MRKYLGVIFGLCLFLGSHQCGAQAYLSQFYSYLASGNIKEASYLINTKIPNKNSLQSISNDEKLALARWYASIYQDSAAFATLKLVVPEKSNSFFLKQSVFIFSQLGYYALALKAAKTLDSLGYNDENRLLLAKCFLQNREFKEADKIIRQFRTIRSDSKKVKRKEITAKHKIAWEYYNLRTQVAMQLGSATAQTLVDCRNKLYLLGGIGSESHLNLLYYESIWWQQQDNKQAAYQSLKEAVKLIGPKKNFYSAHPFSLKIQREFIFCCYDIGNILEGDRWLYRLSKLNLLNYDDNKGLRAFEYLILGQEQLLTERALKGRNSIGRATQIITSNNIAPSLLDEMAELSLEIIVGIDSIVQAGAVLEALPKKLGSKNGYTTSPHYWETQWQSLYFQAIHGTGYKEAILQLPEIWETNLKNEYNFLSHGFVRHKLQLANVAAIGEKYALASQLLTFADSSAKLQNEKEQVTRIEVLLKVGTIHFLQKNYVKAKEKLNRALEIAGQALKNPEMVQIEIYRTLAEVAIAEGNFSVANQYLDDAIYYKNRIYLSGVGALKNLADTKAALLFKQGKPFQAQTILMESVEEKQKYGQTYNLIEPLLLLTEIAISNADLGEATNAVLTANTIAQRVLPDTTLLLLKAQESRANLYLQIGDFKRANETYALCEKKAKQNLGETDVLIAELGVKKLLSSFLAGDKKVLPQFRYYVERLKVLAGEKSLAYANAMATQGRVALELGKLDDASNYLQEASGLYEKISKARSVEAGEILLLLADARTKAGDFKIAESLYNQSQRIFRYIYDDKHPRYIQIQGRKARLAYKKGEEREAINLLEKTCSIYNNYITNNFPFLSEQEKASYWQLLKPDYEFYHFLLATSKSSGSGNAEKLFNNALLTKGLLFNSSRKLRQAIARGKDTVIINKLKEYQALKEELTSLQAQGITSNSEELQQEIEALERWLVAKSQIFSANQAALNDGYKLIQKKLPAQSCAVEIMRIKLSETSLPDTTIYVAIIVTHDDKVKIVNLGNAKTLDNKGLTRYRNSILYHQEDNLTYQRFWKPMEEILAPYTSIYLSADGAFHLINLESIRKPDGTVVGDTKQIVLLTSTKELKAIYVPDSLHKKVKVPFFKNIRNKLVAFFSPQEIIDTTTKQNLAVLVGSPAFNSKKSNTQIDDLPGTREEIKELSAFLGSNKIKVAAYTDSLATEQVLKNMERAPNVLHIATHGYFADESEVDNTGSMLQQYATMQSSMMRSGLLLTNAADVLTYDNIGNPNKSDGVLTSWEAQNLNLENTSVVVLSACETGLGKVESGEGVYGLQRAMMIAGADAVVMSLFKANDAVTKEMMTLLYKGWLDIGNLQVAFRNAILTIKKQYPDPADWAAFVLING